MPTDTERWDWVKQHGVHIQFLGFENEQSVEPLGAERWIAHGGAQVAFIKGQSWHRDIRGYGQSPREAVDNVMKAGRVKPIPPPDVTRTAEETG